MVFLSGVAVSATPDDWSEIQQSLTAKDFDKAIPLLENFIKNLSPSSSPEAHFNLGLAYQEKEKIAQANQQWLLALKTSDSFSLRRKILASLQKSEETLGLNEGITHRRDFWILGLPSFYLAIGISFFFWTSLAGFLIKKKRLLFPSLAILLFLGSFWGYQRMAFPELGITQSAEGKTPLYPDEQTDAPTKNFLPDGVIVLIEEKTDKRCRISSPRSGWVPASSILN
jgi:tetratricopeptide (TPR) repeat protein